MLNPESQSITIPPEVLSATGKKTDELKIEIAIFFYQNFNLSAGEAARFAEISRVAFHYELGKRKVPINFDEADVTEDLKAIDTFNKKFPPK